MTMRWLSFLDFFCVGRDDCNFFFSSLGFGANCFVCICSLCSFLYFTYDFVINILQRRGRFFTALHVMQTRYSEENSVCPSVCLSVRMSHAWIVTKRWKDLSIRKNHTRTFILVFWEEEWLVGGDPFYVKFWVNRPPLERNRRFSTNNRS